MLKPKMVVCVGGGRLGHSDKALVPSLVKVGFWLPPFLCLCFVHSFHCLIQPHFFCYLVILSWV